MEKKPVVLIAGPMSGHDDFNRPAFFAMEQRLKALGYAVINPANLPSGLTREAYIEINLAYAAYCDVVVFLDGHLQSSGCKRIRQFVEQNEIKIMNEIEEVRTLSEISQFFDDFDKYCRFVNAEAERHSVRMRASRLMRAKKLGNLYLQEAKGLLPRYVVGAVIEAQLLEEAGHKVAVIIHNPTCYTRCDDVAGSTDADWLQLCHSTFRSGSRAMRGYTAYVVVGKDLAPEGVGRLDKVIKHTRKGLNLPDAPVVLIRYDENGKEVKDPFGDEDKKQSRPRIMTEKEYKERYGDGADYGYGFDIMKSLANTPCEIRFNIK